MNHIFRKVMVSVISAALLLGGTALPSPNAQAAGGKVSITKKVTVTVGKTAKIKLKNNKKKVAWKVSKGKELIKLTKKTKNYAAVKGIKTGTAKVQAVIGKKKYSCTVKVSAPKKPPANAEKPSVTNASVPTATPSGNTPINTVPTKVPSVDTTAEPSAGATATTSPSGDTPTTTAPTPTVSPAGETPTTTAPTPTVSPAGDTPATSVPTSNPSGDAPVPAESPDVTPELRTIVYDMQHYREDLDEIMDLEKKGEFYNIIVADGNTRIPCDSFAHMVSVTLPDSLTSIQAEGFKGCSSLTSITIPENVTSIGEQAFYGCRSLTSITIPEKVSSIEDGSIFAGCDSLTTVKVSEKNTVYDSRGNCNAIIKTSTNTLIAGCDNTVIPDSVTSIGGWAFERRHGLKSVTLSDSVGSITIPDSVKSIGKYAFSGCSRLESVTIPDSVTSIGDFAFANCGVVKVWNDGNDDYSEYIGSLTSVTIPNSVKSIGYYAFANANRLTSITIPDSVTSIGDYAFLCADRLTSITWKGTTYTNADAFADTFGFINAYEY